MARHRFGLGEYKYFAYPLPDVVAGLRESMYARLAEVANEWAIKLEASLNIQACIASSSRSAMPVDRSARRR